jgi:hypothetical protein
MTKSCPSIVANTNRLLHRALKENLMDDRVIDREDRLRDQAYRIWIEKGCPDGEAEKHWRLAKDLLAIRKDATAVSKPRNAGAGSLGEPAEWGVGIDSHGDVAALTDRAGKSPLVHEDKHRRS